MKSNSYGAGVGFFVLTSQEVNVLAAFNEKTNELLQPESSLAGNEAYDAIRSLRKRGLITGNRPHRLTRAGLRAKKSLFTKDN